jgi:erythronate-4-phosphate dehydrogenase
MIKILADDKIPFLRGVLEPYAEVEYLPGNQINKSHVLKADALLIRTRTKCTPALLKNSAVRFIATATIGFDHIDTQFCETNNIKWINAPGCNSSSVQQYIASALLKIATEFRFDLKDKTIGIIGVGNVGSKVEKFARIIGMKVLLCDPPRELKEGSDKFTKLEKLLKESDFITLHVPLNFVGEDATYHLFDEKKFKKIRKGAWFFNSSRGEVAETTALKNIIRSGRINGSVIDVWENEPDIDTDLMENSFISTPHIAGYSTDGKANGTAIVVNALSDFFGLPLKSWYPGDVPLPQNPVIEIDCNGKTIQDIIHEAVNHTYDINEDDTMLRFLPSDFEKQRGNYRLRREFSAYKVNLVPDNTEAPGILEKLGFQAGSF